VRAGIQIATRPFKVPLYPWLPLAFALNCAYVLYASLAYVRTGAVVGVAVLLFGVRPHLPGPSRTANSRLLEYLHLQQNGVASDVVVTLTAQHSYPSRR